MKVLDELETLFQELEIQNNNYLNKSATIEDLIKKLLMVIQNDNFNSAEAYNYCKILKELLNKKLEIDDLKCKCKQLLAFYTSKQIKDNMDKKEIQIRNKRYTARIFHKEDDIGKYINDNFGK